MIANAVEGLVVRGESPTVTVIKQSRALEPVKQRTPENTLLYNGLKEEEAER